MNNAKQMCSICKPASEKIQNMFFLNVQDSNHFAQMADDKLLIACR